MMAYYILSHVTPFEKWKQKFIHGLSTNFDKQTFDVRVFQTQTVKQGVFIKN